MKEEVEERLRVLKAIGTIAFYRAKYAGSGDSGFSNIAVLVEVLLDQISRPCPECGHKADLLYVIGKF